MVIIIDIYISIKRYIIKRKIIKKIFPKIRSRSDNNQATYNVSLMHNNKFNDITVNNMIPLTNIKDINTNAILKHNDAAFSTITDEGCVLIEKAVATLLGSYLNLLTLPISDMIYILSGGYPKQIILNDNEKDNFIHKYSKIQPCISIIDSNLYTKEQLNKRKDVYESYGLRIDAYYSVLQCLTMGKGWYNYFNV